MPLRRTREFCTALGVVCGKKAIRLNMMLSTLLRQDVEEVYFGDNTACERIIESGSNELCYMKRTQGVSLSFAHHVMGGKLARVPSGENISDIFTKPLEKEAFLKFRKALGIW